MARGDCEAAYCPSPKADGIDLVRGKVPWLNQHGHLDQPERVDLYVAIPACDPPGFEGAETKVSAKRTTALRL